MLLQPFEARDSPDRDDIHAFDRRTKSPDKREDASADAATAIAGHMSRAPMSAVDHRPEFDLDNLVEWLIAAFACQ